MQEYKPHYMQEYKPHYMQEYKPHYMQEYKPHYTQEYKSNYKMEDNSMSRRTRVKIAAVILLIGLLFDADRGLSQTAVQPAQNDQIDAYITSEMQTRRIPGAAIAVVEKGKVILKRAYGMANLETESPVKTNSVFELASVTKPFTATAIMMLVEEGKIQLDNPVSAYLDHTPEIWKN